MSPVSINDLVTASLVQPYLARCPHDDGSDMNILISKKGFTLKGKKFPINRVAPVLQSRFRIQKMIMLCRVLLRACYSRLTGSGGPLSDLSVLVSSLCLHVAGITTMLSGGEWG